MNRDIINLEIHQARSLAGESHNKQTLAALSTHTHPYVRKQVATNIHTSAETLTYLSQDHDFSIVKRVALNPNTPSGVLNILAQHENLDIARFATHNPNVSEETLYINSRKNHTLAVHAADNPSCPSVLLEELSASENTTVREYVSGNPNTSEQVLTNLSNDLEETVRAEVALNSNTPIETLNKLSLDNSINVLTSIARNPNLTNEIIQQLTEQKIEILIEILTPTTTLPVLEKIAQLDSIELKVIVAETNCKGLGPTLEILGQSPDIYLREAVAGNWETPTQTLTYLFETQKEAELNYLLAQNINTSEEIFQKLLKMGKQHVLLELVHNPNVPLTILEKLAESEYEQVRANVCTQMKTPEHLVKKLIKDKDSQVRQEAERTRKMRVSFFVQTLEGEEKKMAELLAPTFTGFTDELQNVLKNLKIEQQVKVAKTQQR